MFGRISTVSGTNLTSFGKAGPIFATRHFRKTRPESQASLIEASDGALYVLKMTGNPREPNRLANELLGTALCEAVGLPAPVAVPIIVTEAFLSQSPKLNFGRSDVNYAPVPGLHFGTRFLGERDNTSRLLQLLAPSHILRVRNRQCFLGMYLLDVVANLQGRRQAMFVRNIGVLDLQAVFVDHGQMFGGPAWNTASNACLPLYSDKVIYMGLWDEADVSAWIANLRSQIPSALSEAVDHVPKNWFTGDIKQVVENILRRLDRLPDLAYEYRLIDSGRFRKSFEESAWQTFHTSTSIRTAKVFT